MIPIHIRSSIISPAYPEKKLQDFPLKSLNHHSNAEYLMLMGEVNDE